MTRHFLLLAATFLVIAIAPTASAQDASSLVASAGVAGEFAAPVCRDGVTLEALPFSRVASSFVTESGLMIDTGGLLARQGVTRFAARQDPDALARLAKGLGYHALALGETDLGDPRALLLARLRALRDAGVPVLASNLQCTESANELCSLLWTAERGLPMFRGQTALLSFIEPEALERIAPDSRVGIRLLPLRTSIRDAVRQARARGAETVVAIIDSGRGASAIATATAAISTLESNERPDLVLSADAGSELLFARPASVRPAFVAPAPRGATRVAIRRAGERYDFLATPLEGEQAHPAVQEFIEAVGAEYCAEWGMPLDGGELTRPMDSAALAELTAGIMREHTGADLPIFNVAALDRRWTREQGTLSRSDVQVGIQYDEALVEATVSALWLRNLARSMPDGIIVPGLTIINPRTSIELVKVNGRVIDDAAMYRVVTIRFLAEGGDGALPEGVDWEPVEGASVRAVVESYLSEERDGDPRDALVDAYGQLEWTLGLNAGLSFTGNAVRDSGAYGEGPLTNQSQVLVGLSGTLRLSALSRNAAWQNEIVANYSLAATTETDGFDEGNDQLTYRTSAQWRRPRVLRDELYVPDLIVEGLLRTEFTAAEMRDTHFLNLRFVAGPQWRFHPKLQFRVVGGAEVIEAANSADRRVEPGFGGQLTLTPFVLLRELPRSVTISTTLDYFASGFGGSVRHLIQGAFDFQLNLTRTVGLAFNVNMYGLQEGDSDFSFALGTSANLNIGFNDRWLGR